MVQPTDIDLRRGEVLGIGGLLGSGRTELARLLFALDSPDSGEIRLAGRPVKIDSPTRALQLGMALCPEDRKAEGIVADLTVRENIALALQAKMGVWQFLTPKKQAEIALRYVKALQIKTADLDTPVGQLSGGNQQKVVLARWLATEPEILILDEPTRGIDVGAKQEIMGEVRDLARSGKAVMFISSEMDEVVRLSDRILVMRDRRKVGELPGGSDEQAVYQLIATGS
jgi:simple sugar transport system ATP-binding protein